MTAEEKLEYMIETIKLIENVYTELYTTFMEELGDCTATNSFFHRREAIRDLIKQCHIE